MSKKITVDIDLNRVEGDLEFQLDIEDNTVIDARCKGIMYRGFEQLMIGREATDSVILTSRVCGICGTAHMYSAALALEQIWQVEVPPLATLVRNLCLGVENAQSDLRHSFLMFTPDFCNPRYEKQAFYEQALKLYHPFKGKVYRDVLTHTRKLLEIVAIFGGQWPHSTYMMPGGIVSEPNQRKVIDSLGIINSVKRWYEEAILDGALSDFENVRSADELEQWMNTHPNAVLADFTQISRQINLHEMGQGADLMISYGAYCDPDNWGVDIANQGHLVQGGIFDINNFTDAKFDQSMINEHVKHSWFKSYADGLHPAQGRTIPDYDPNSNRYTWAKAPRYGDRVAQTGPLSEMVIGGDPLMRDLLAKYGDNAWLRQFARIYRVGGMLKKLSSMLSSIQQRLGESYITSIPEEQKIDGSGYGLIQAARGALGHWVTVEQGKLSHYQIITPTAWNASPKDSADKPGHWEKSVIGMQLDDKDNPLEIGHIVRSHDACLVCTVHMVDTKKNIRTKQRFSI